MVEIEERKKRGREKQPPALGERRARTTRSVDVSRSSSRRSASVDDVSRSSARTPPISRSSTRRTPPPIISDTTRASCEKDPSALPDTAARLIRREGGTNVTCLTFGLQPGFAAHGQIMCNKCISFHGICLQNGWNTTEKKRAKKYLCETP